MGLLKKMARLFFLENMILSYLLYRLLFYEHISYDTTNHKNMKKHIIYTICKGMYEFLKNAR